MTTTPVCIVSFPKSGRTWLKAMLGKALCEEHGVDESHMLDFDRLAEKTGIRETSFLHDGSSIKEHQRFDELETSKAEYADSAVVLVVRDPRDVIVSSFFQATRRRHVFEGPLEEFIRDPRYGIRKCAAFHRIWAENQHVPREFVLVRYEDMMVDAPTALRSVLAVLGQAGISESAIEAAVAFGDFENMQRLESSGHFEDPILRPGDRQDPDSFKVRRGKVGGFADYLSEPDCEYMRQIMEDEGGAFYKAYISSPEKTDGSVIA